VPPLFDARPLLSDEAWNKLAREIGLGRAVTQVQSSLDYLRKRCGATFCLTERHYVDRDHRANVSHFYSKQFKGTSSLCQRFHFFRTEWKPVPGAIPPPVGEYLGYLIQRPSQESPVGRTVLTIREAIPGAEVLCAGTFKPHINETELCVDGVPFCQQDSVVMSCAETAIWIAARVMTKHFGHPLVMPADISSPETIGFSRYGRILPSGGLHAEQMAHVLNSLGFAPLYYDKAAYEAKKWDPLALATWYLCSKIPVVIGLPEHAVTACGVVVDRKRLAKRGADAQSAAEMVTALVVQDDARGPYRLLARDKQVGNALQPEFSDLLLRPRVADANEPFVTFEKIDSIIVPLPEKVYLAADTVERTVREFLGTFVVGPVQKLVASGLFQNSGLAEVGDALSGNGDAIVFVIRCRRSVHVRAGMMNAPLPVRRALAEIPLPRYIWCAELTTRKRVLNKAGAEIVGEIYLDATASPYSGLSAVLFGHVGGLVFQRPGVIEGQMEGQFVAELPSRTAEATIHSAPYQPSTHIPILGTRETQLLLPAGPSALTTAT